MNFLFGPAKVENTDLVLGEIALAFIVMVLGFIVPFIVRKIVKKERSWVNLVRSFGKIIGYAALLVLIALFLRFEGIYPFETRGWVTVVIVGAVIAALWVVLKYRRTVPLTELDASRYEHYDRYLPKPKKK